MCAAPLKLGGSTASLAFIVSNDQAAKFAAERAKYSNLASKGQKELSGINLKKDISFKANIEDSERTITQAGLALGTLGVQKSVYRNILNDISTMRADILADLDGEDIQTLNTTLNMIKTNIDQKANAAFHAGNQIAVSDEDLDFTLSSRLNDKITVKSMDMRTDSLSRKLKATDAVSSLSLHSSPVTFSDAHKDVEYVITDSSDLSITKTIDASSARSLDSIVEDFASATYDVRATAITSLESGRVELDDATTSEAKLFNVNIDKARLNVSDHAGANIKLLYKDKPDDEDTRELKISTISKKVVTDQQVHEHVASLFKGGTSKLEFLASNNAFDLLNGSSSEPNIKLKAIHDIENIIGIQVGETKFNAAAAGNLFKMNNAAFTSGSNKFDLGNTADGKFAYINTAGALAAALNADGDNMANLGAAIANVAAGAITTPSVSNVKLRYTDIRGETQTTSIPDFILYEDESFAGTGTANAAKAALGSDNAILESLKSYGFDLEVSGSAANNFGVKLDYSGTNTASFFEIPSTGIATPAIDKVTIDHEAMFAKMPGLVKVDLVFENSAVTLSGSPGVQTISSATIPLFDFRSQAQITKDAATDAVGFSLVKDSGSGTLDVMYSGFDLDAVNNKEMQLMFEDVGYKVDTISMTAPASGLTKELDYKTADTIEQTLADIKIVTQDQRLEAIRVLGSINEQIVDTISIAESNSAVIDSRMAAESDYRTANLASNMELLRINLPEIMNNMVVAGYGAETAVQMLKQDSTFTSRINQVIRTLGA